MPTLLEQIIEVVETLRDYAELGETPENNEICAELKTRVLEMLKELGENESTL